MARVLLTDGIIASSGIFYYLLQFLFIHSLALEGREGNPNWSAFQNFQFPFAAAYSIQLNSLGKRVHVFINPPTTPPFLEIS